jgi:YVTN family beta-propeller protein
MKRIKILLISLGVLFLMLRLSIFIFRLPSYSIETSGKLYVVSKLSEDVQVIDLSTGEQIAEIPIDILCHEAVATSDKKRVVVTNTLGKDGNLVKIINTESNRIESSINSEINIKASGIVALPELNKVAVIDLINNDLLVLNVETKSIEKQIQTQQKKSHLLVLHPKKTIAYVTNVDSGSISVVDLSTNNVIKIIPCGVGRKGIAITPDGSEIWVTNTKENTIHVINTTNYKITNVLKSGNESMKLKFSVDGKTCLFVNATDGTISVYDQQSKKKIKTITLHGKGTRLERILYHTPRPVNIIMHSNGLYAFVANSNADRIEVIDMKNFKIISTIGTGRVPDAMVFVE